MNIPDILDIYSQEWKRIFANFLDFGFSEKEVAFTLRWEGESRKSPIIILMDRRLFRLMCKVSSDGSSGFSDFFDYAEICPVPHSKVEISLHSPKAETNIIRLTLLQGIAYVTLEYLRGRRFRRKRPSQVKIIGGNRQIKEEAARLLPVRLIRMIGDPHYHKNENYFFLWVDLGLGKKKIIGETPKELIQSLLKHLGEAQEEL